MKTRKQINQLKRTLKIQLQILRWLSLLQFPSCPGGLAGRLSHFALFRRTGDPDFHQHKILDKNRRRINRIQQIMNIRFQILRWLSLLQFPAFSAGEAGELALFSLFRRTPALLLKNNTYKTLKYNSLK